MTRHDRAQSFFLVLCVVLGAASSGCEGDLGGRPLRSDAGVPADGSVPPSDAPGTDAPGASDAGLPGCFEDTVATGAMALTIDEAVAGGGCSTSVVRPLSEQLIGEIQCLAPGAMGRIDDIPGLSLGAAASAWLQAPAASALRDAVVAGGGGLSVNSTLRTLPQQLMLYRWYLAGSCGITLAARPGTSPHESGLALDTSDYSAWRTRLEAHSWRWLGSSDLPHFDFIGGGTMDIEGLSVLAFQRLWNRNHPEDVIAEDGAYGPQTEARLLRSPAEGFPVGPGCDEPPPPAPFAVDWTRAVDGVYVLTATAEAAVDTVEYLADGRRLAQVSRGPTGDFALEAGTCLAGGDHTIEAIARDAAGAEITRGVALLQATAGTAVYVRPRAPSTYEIGLERAAAAVVAIEVDADGTLLTDATTGATRSARGAVLSAFTLLGPRTFVVRLYDASGAVLDTRTVTLTLL